MDRVPPKPRRKPKQARSREIVKAIAEACERILCEEGPDALNTNRIAEVAGVTIGSLYRYFPNKEAIVTEVYERTLEALAETYETGWERSRGAGGLPLEEILRLHIAGNADMHVQLLSIHEEFYRRHQESLDLGHRSSERTDRSYLARAERWLEERLEEHRDRIDVPDVTLASFILTRSIAGALRSAARDAPEQLRDERFREELRQMALRYLGVRSEPRES